MISSDLHYNGINNPSILFYSQYYQLSYKGVACKSFTKSPYSSAAHAVTVINKCPVHAKYMTANHSYTTKTLLRAKCFINYRDSIHYRDI